MSALLTWYRAQEESPTIHPVALAAEFHYRFVRIHPFDDGNGRMSRLLMNLILLRHGYPMTVIQAADRNRYLSALAEADADEPEPFLRFIIENVEAGLQLMIRAARGESIDEPSDLDKKLALLKKQMLTKEAVNRKMWNLETQGRFYNALTKFWLDDLAVQAERFDELFVNKGIVFAYYSQFDSVSNNDETLLEAQKLAERSLLSASHKFDSMLFRFFWNEFREENNSFNLRLIIEFSFHKNSFEVNYTIHEGSSQEENLSWWLLFSSTYEPEYDYARIQEINHQLANKVYDFIAAKLAEAGTPPA